MKYHHNLPISYPEKNDANMGGTKPHLDEVLDENYPYYDKRPDFLFRQRLFNSILYTFAYAACRIRYGLRLRDRKNFWNNRKLLRQGAITICNHVFNWDYFCVQAAIWPQSECAVTWKHNVFVHGGTALRLTGGIPIPDTMSGLKAFDKDLMRLLKDKRWLHFYPEGSLWYYEEGIRPFKKGAFTYAVRANKPVLPLAISYRPAHGLYKLFKKNYPLCTISIGTPILPDPHLGQASAVEKMRLEAEQSVKDMIEKYTPEAKEKKGKKHEKSSQKEN